MKHCFLNPFRSQLLGLFCYNMQKHCGEELTVRHISENGRYVLTDNEGSGTRELYMWSWSEWMFEERK